LRQPIIGVQQVEAILRRGAGRGQTANEIQRQQQAIKLSPDTKKEADTLKGQ
jgi:hypothetical protein